MSISTPIFNMFGRSPIRPLQTHMSSVQRCVESLLPFFEAVQTQNWDEATKLQQQIANLENEADDLKKDLRLHLPKGLFLPVPRTDILEILTLQDKIANMAKDIAGLVLGRKMQFPDAIANDFMSLAKRSIDASMQAHKAINELDELLETGFRGKEVALVEEMINKLDAIETDTDAMQIKIRKQLFEMEQTLPPIDAMFLYLIIESTGELADRAQAVGGQLELLLAR